MNPLRQLTQLGQSVWLDYIRRDLYTGPKLDELIEHDCLRGMTTNPTIFEKAIAESELYDAEIRALDRHGFSALKIFDGLTITDVQHAADRFRNVYESSGGNDGFVSIEVGPRMARDTHASIVEARRLWHECARPNVMVKIPGTSEGISAIRQCLSEGININITLLFSVERYREVINAYFTALESRVDAGEPIDRIHSVASFFVSRVDTNANKKLAAVAIDKNRSAHDRSLATELTGQYAIANARIAYQAFQETFSTQRFSKLRHRGAQIQRPLWASTSTKDPAYPDLYYVEALIAPDTVNTMPMATLEAYRDHGNPQVRIHDHMADAHSISGKLHELGIDPRRIAMELEEEGIQKFASSYDDVLKRVADKQKAVFVA
jgi:transaldolase